MLSGKNLCKSFGEREVLKGIDIEITPGSISCMIGPSGTGKTTLLRALSLLDYPDKGVINAGGVEYTFPMEPKQKITPPWPRVTVVFQSLFLWPHLTLRENVMLPARNCNPDAGRDLDELIELFEMEHFIDNYPNQASTGQGQRVALARALILNPEYILMDEITAALDIEQTSKILGKLKHLKKRGIGLFIITHQMGFARKAADQILFMDDGTIVESGGSEILEKPKTKRLQEFLSMSEIIA